MKLKLIIETVIEEVAYDSLPGGIISFDTYFTEAYFIKDFPSALQVGSFTEAYFIKDFPSALQVGSWASYVMDMS
jgi:hypothetical protein